MDDADAPHIKDGSFLLPHLCADLSSVDEARIPWHCDYDHLNLRSKFDLGGEEGISKTDSAFSLAKQYEPRSLSAA